MSNPNIRPRFSIVVAVHDQAQEIAQNLPVLLSQQYESYEVIVVDMSSTDGTTDVLKQLKDSHPHLYTTFLPKYQFQKNPLRLADTIGVKAAKYEWIVFADINKLPPSEHWLEELAQFTCRPTVLLLGYIQEKTNDVRLQTFDNVADAQRKVKKTEREIASGGNGARWLRYLRGRYDFMVVRADKGHETLKMFENTDKIKI